MRSRLLAEVRAFFHARDFLEVDTPVRIRFPALEEHIDAEPCGTQFLRTSPELHMKRLLAEGHPRLFQIGPCFRQGERGNRHLPEFTMLEWYRSHADYRDILADTRELLATLQQVLLAGSPVQRGGAAIDLCGAWQELTVADAYLRHAGWNPVEAFDADRFDLDLVERVEPALSTTRPVVLIDYPSPCAALARVSPLPPHAAERWELYIGGMELANAYSELNDAEIQRDRFAQCAERRHMAGKPVYALDEDFLKALPLMPPSGGIALGIDRLVMLFTGCETIDEVVAFVE